MTTKKEIMIVSSLDTVVMNSYDLETLNESMHQLDLLGKDVLDLLQDPRHMAADLARLQQVRNRIENMKSILKTRIKRIESSSQFGA